MLALSTAGSLSEGVDTASALRSPVEGQLALPQERDLSWGQMTWESGEPLTLPLGAAGA